MCRAPSSPMKRRGISESWPVHYRVILYLVVVNTFFQDAILMADGSVTHSATAQPLQFTRWLAVQTGAVHYPTARVTPGLHALVDWNQFSYYGLHVLETAQGHSFFRNCTLLRGGGTNWERAKVVAPETVVIIAVVHALLLVGVRYLPVVTLFPFIVVTLGASDNVADN